MSTRPLIIICSFIFIAACGAVSDKKAEGAGNGGKDITTIQWIDSARDYGTVIMGQKLAVAFRFKNTGTKPLVIESVHPGCGCTVADFPKEPIAPGAEGEITGVFDSHDREGTQHKEINVKTNTPGSTQNISFDVNVIKKPGVPDTEEQ
ncbi:MAG: DUF1573 domain-containing protein [Flavitalea sp.]